MQAVAPELMDIAKEPKETLEMYGAEPGKASFANNCLLARRLVETRRALRAALSRGVGSARQPGEGSAARTASTPIGPRAALIKDLKQRGLLDDTLVIWGGEFGRTPMVQGGSDGRDHHPNAFTMWMAGGGIKPGVTLRRNRRTRLQRRRKTRSTSTICTRPSCTCSASITPS